MIGLSKLLFDASFAHDPLRCGKEASHGVKNRHAGWIREASSHPRLPGFVYRFTGVARPGYIHADCVLIARIGDCDEGPGRCCVSDRFSDDIWKEVFLFGKKVKLAVTGMSCEHCEHTVEKNLAEIERVTKVKADHEKNVVTVHYKGERPSFDEVTLRVKNLGYEAGETWL